MQNELIQKARELLETGQVKLVIGYEAGSVPFKSTPLFADTPEEAERLVWNPTCVNNLAVYLPQAVSRGKVAVVVKPCDVKSVVELIRENQIKRDDVMTIVVPCPGVLNPDALKTVDLRDLRSIAWNADGITMTTGKGENGISREKAFLAKCLRCDVVEPAIVDLAIGSPATRDAADNLADIREYEKLSPAERRAFWTGHFSRCIRCYACRSACPGCYCRECFVDKPAQMWASKATDPVANWFFHMTRMMHIAGRCTGCGECERACPMNIPLSLMSRRMAIDVKEMFGSVAGSDQDALPVLGAFEAHDPDPCPEP
jgi:ferredoxin